MTINDNVDNESLTPGILKLSYLKVVMSLIFQKLENLKNRTSNQGDLQGPKLQHGKNIYTFRKLIFSPRGAFLIFATIAGFGLISFYSLSFLKTYLDSGSSKAIVVQHRQPDMPFNEMLPGNEMLPHMDNAPQEAPPGSEMPTDFESPQGIEPGLGEPASSKKSVEFKVPEYFHQAKTETDSQSPDIPDAPKNYFLPSLKSIYSTLIKKANPFDHLAPSTADDSKPFTHLAPSTAAVDSKPAKPKFQPNIYKTLEPEESKKNISTAHIPKITSPEKKEEARQEVVRLAKQKRTQKISNVAMLAADLEDAIEKNDDIRTNELLARLTRITDVNSIYYLKLKAFMEIKRKNYGPAKKLLKNVLAKDKTDFEANINMAIIEIREQKLAKARQRLIRLKELYPSQTMVDDLLDML